VDEGARTVRLNPGIELFNVHRFFDAHEAWEELWLASTGDEKRFLQGLIQLAAGYHHVQRGTARPGGIRLLEKAAAKLVHFDDGFMEVSFAQAVAAARAHAKRLENGEQIGAFEFPKLRYN
jgi:predicted metal-dependent hydrolase